MQIKMEGNTVVLTKSLQRVITEFPVCSRVCTHGCRHTSSQAKEGVAGCQTTKQAQQAGIGRQEYLPGQERPGAPGNSPAD